MPNVVYHYTSPQGAFDILRNKTLWFTDCQYLNDMGEFVYIFEPLKEAYEKISRERGEDVSKADDFLKSLFESPYEDYDFENLLRRSEKGFSRGYPPKFRYYVLCASMDADTANMWNCYVKDGAYRGYNLGIDRNIITDWFSQLADNRIKLVEGPIIYNHKKQVDAIYEKLKELFDQFDNMMEAIGEGDDSPAIEAYQDGLSEYIIKQKLFFKSPALSGEKEYRFVLKAHSGLENYACDGLELKFRVGTSGIITPYIEWHFGNLKPEILKQITLSPMIEPELAKASFKRFLANDVYQNIRIKPSSIKLRF